jgi:predicted transcriptional regulator
MTHSFTGAPVMYKGKMMVIITEVDFLIRDRAIHFVGIFIANRVNPIPVVNDGKFVGIIARSDIARIFQF